MVVIWDKEDCLKEAEEQLSCKEKYEEVTDDPSYLIGAMHRTLEKLWKRVDIDLNILKIFWCGGYFSSFYLLPKINKTCWSVPGRPVISNSSFYRENISGFLDFHLKPIAAKVKSYIKDTNDFLRKLQNLPKLPDDVILCTIDVVGLYPNIPNEEGLLFLKKALDKRRNKTVSTESLIELAELVLRNNYFEFNDRFKKQKEDTAIGTKFAPPLCHYFHGCLRGRNLGVPY